VSWQIVVGVLILIAIAVHFGEKAMERAKRAKRRARQQAHLHEVSCTRDIREEWSADLRAMTVRVVRQEAGSASGEPERYELERTDSGVWSMKSSAIVPELPASVAEQLEKRYQLLVSKTRSG
jgi:hypothetical protein